MKNDLNQLKEKLEKKSRQREKKKRTTMKVSGKSVFRLQAIIKKQGQK